MTNPETIIQNDIRFHVGRRSDVTLWRNSTGEMRLPQGGSLKFGLCVGSADIVGIVRVPLPNPVGVFLAIEVKTATGRATKEQINFLDHVNKMGGIAFIARSVDEANEELDRRISLMRMGAIGNG